VGGGGGTLLCHGVLCGHERFVKGKQLVKESLHPTELSQYRQS